MYINNKYRVEIFSFNWSTKVLENSLNVLEISIQSACLNFRGLFFPHLFVSLSFYFYFLALFCFQFNSLLKYVKEKHYRIWFHVWDGICVYLYVCKCTHMCKYTHGHIYIHTYGCVFVIQWIRLGLGCD